MIGYSFVSSVGKKGIGECRNVKIPLKVFTWPVLDSSLLEHNDKIC